MLLPSNQTGWLTSGDCLFFATVLHLLFQTFQPLLQRGDGSVLQEHIHRLHALLQFRKHEHVQQMIYILDHMTRLHKAIVWIFLRQLWGVLDFPVFQQMQIIAQHPLTVHLIVAEGPRQRIGLFQCHGCRGLVRVDAEVI